MQVFNDNISNNNITLFQLYSHKYVCRYKSGKHNYVSKTDTEYVIHAGNIRMLRRQHRLELFFFQSDQKIIKLKTYE